MRNYLGIAAAGDAVRTFVITNQATLPAHILDKVLPHTGTGSSPVDLVCHFVEAVYANGDDVSAEGKEIAAGAANLIDIDGYWGKLDGRAPAMSMALRRDSGEDAPTGGWPAEEDDPAAKPEYRAPPEEPEE